MTFAVKGVSDTTYVTCDEYSKPLIEAPPILIYPRPAAMTGLGKPAAVVGKPWAVVGRDSINASGLAWWNARYGTSVEPCQVCVILYDPHTAAWGTYEAYMDVYQYSGARPQSTVALSEFRVRFSAIETTTTT